MNKFLSISIISDRVSWINTYIPEFIDKIKKNGYMVIWEHNINKLQKGDICFLIGCSQIMSKNIMTVNKINLVVHESKLPEGKGWSPLSWQILEGKNIIPITLLEVDDRIDSGKIFLQSEMVFDGHELINELRDVQAKYTFKLCEEFIANYPDILEEGIIQKGKESFYSKRKAKNSELNIENSLINSFNLLRIVDNDRYPAFFYYKGHRYKLQIEKYIK